MAFTVLSVAPLGFLLIHLSKLGVNIKVCPPFLLKVELFGEMRGPAWGIDAFCLHPEMLIASFYCCKAVCSSSATPSAMILAIAEMSMVMRRFHPYHAGLVFR